MLIAAILGAIACYIIGLNIGRSDLAGARQGLQQLRAENQKLKTQVGEQSAAQIAMQAKLAATEAALEAVIPAKDTYNVGPNQSLIVAEGRLTIGLIGPPNNESINININGKQQSAVPGEVIKIALDASTTCQVRVQSFDMFKAVLGASCALAQSR